MKSEERHELQKNELAKVAGQATAFYDRYQNQILWGIVVVLLALAAWIYIARSSQVAAQSAWASVQQSGRPEDYRDVAIQFPNTNAASISKLQAGLAWLNMGVHSAFNNREQANLYLKDAREQFEQLVEQPGLDKSIREQAMYGLAQTLESISGADTEAAVKAYEQLLKEFPDSIYQETIEERITELKSPVTQDFLAWYQKQNPKPPEQDKPQDGQAPGANISAPKPGGEVGGLGLPAPPPVSGDATAPESSAPATESTPEATPATTEEQGAEAKGEAEEAKKEAVPEESKGPALPTDAPAAEEK